MSRSSNSLQALLFSFALFSFSPLHAQPDLNGVWVLKVPRDDDTFRKTYLELTGEKTRQVQNVAAVLLSIQGG